jgi:thymidylate synthase
VVFEEEFNNNSIESTTLNEVENDKAPLNEVENSVENESHKGESDIIEQLHEEESKREDNLSISSDSSRMTDDDDSTTTPVVVSNTVVINGIEVELTDIAQDDTLRQRTLFKKENRADLTEDKRNDLFEKATKSQLSKFDIMSLSLSDEVNWMIPITQASIE